VRLWRISDFANLSGDGGLLESGRWHSLGRRVVYLSDHPASALLEIIVHLEVHPDDIPDSFQLLTVEVSDDVVFDRVEDGDLSADWRSTPSETQGHGGRWLSVSRTALLRVPSAIVPFAWNWLLNPDHHDMDKVGIADVRRVTFDPRLLD
jgi:RES domain-containing protein